MVLPAFAGRADIRRILFVGCAEYTHSYQQLFERAEYYTLDVDPASERYGSEQPGRHFTASLADVASLFEPERLDLVLVNGVFGYGLDDREEAERAVAGCFTILKPRGMLMIGWNDLPQCKPFEILELRALDLFRAEAFPPLDGVEDVERVDGSYRVLSDYQHVFSFFAKPTG